MLNLEAQLQKEKHLDSKVAVLPARLILAWFAILVVPKLTQPAASNWLLQV
jgi:hypothetical protein